MEAMKEQMTTMMEAMRSVKKIMEANAVAATSGLGKDLGSTNGPMM